MSEVANELPIDEEENVDIEEEQMDGEINDEDQTDEEPIAELTPEEEAAKLKESVEYVREFNEKMKAAHAQGDVNEQIRLSDELKKALTPYWYVRAKEQIKEEDRRKFTEELKEEVFCKDLIKDIMERANDATRISLGSSGIALLGKTYERMQAEEIILSSQIKPIICGTKYEDRTFIIVIVQDFRGNQHVHLYEPVDPEQDFTEAFFDVTWRGCTVI